MTRASTAVIVRAARASGYAVPAVNVVDGFSMHGVIAAAQKARSPIIVQTSVKTVRMIGAPVLASMFRFEADTVDVPVSLHLDHCPDRSVIETAISNGWSSVLFDASDRHFDQALAETAEVVTEAHARGVDVESEIENISGVEDGVGREEQGELYSVEQLVHFVRVTECDLFAPALGTAHGKYITRPRLHPERAHELDEALGIPLVLHGGTGLASDEFRSFIEAGCSKINISTSLKHSYLAGLLTALESARASDKWDPPTVFTRGGVAVSEDVTGHIDMFGSNGRTP